MPKYEVVLVKPAEYATVIVSAPTHEDAEIAAEEYVYDNMWLFDGCNEIEVESSRTLPSNNKSKPDCYVGDYEEDEREAV